MVGEVGSLYQSAGEADHSHGGLGGLGDVKQVVEQRLVLVVGEQVELVQDEENRAAAAAIAWPETANGDLAKMLRECQQPQHANRLKSC